LQCDRDKKLGPVNGFRSPTIRGNALMVAVLAWGDIAYVEGDNFGNVPALGLATYGGKLPTAASWQRVLAEKQILKPTPGRFGALASSRVVHE
jgi:hypothetical protein